MSQTSMTYDTRGRATVDVYLSPPLRGGDESPITITYVRVTERDESRGWCAKVTLGYSTGDRARVLDAGVGSIEDGAAACEVTEIGEIVPGDIELLIRALTRLAEQAPAVGILPAPQRADAGA